MQLAVKVPLFALPHRLVIGYLKSKINVEH